MKILMVLDREFPPDLRVENEIEALSSSGHEIHLACFTRKNAPPYEKMEFCHVHRRSISGLQFKSSVGVLTLPFYFSFWRSFLDTLFSENHFDAIHVHDLPLVQIGAEMKTKYSCILTADLHENWPAYLRIAKHTNSIMGRLLSPNNKWIKYEQEVLLRADNIVVVVEEAMERLIKMGIKSDHIHVVSNTPNKKYFAVSQSSNSETDTILFYAGGINYHRGLQTVVRAMAMVKDTHPGLRFWILGYGNYESDLQQLTRELGVEEQVLFRGFFPFKEMTEILMQADYALIPHLKSDHTDSTIPHKLFQYMYAGKPVIASDCDPIRRIINESNSGYIYSSFEPENLAEIFKKLKKADAEILGANGIHWVQEKYNWENDSAVLKDLYS